MGGCDPALDRARSRWSTAVAARDPPGARDPLEADDRLRSAGGPLGGTAVPGSLRCHRDPAKRGAGREPNCVAAMAWNARTRKGAVSVPDASAAGSPHPVPAGATARTPDGHGTA